MDILQVDVTTYPLGGVDTGTMTQAQIDADTIWTALLSVGGLNGPGSTTTDPADDGLAALLSYPTGSMSGAKIPDTAPVTMIFIHDGTVDDPTSLMAEGVVGTTYITVRRPLPGGFHGLVENGELHPLWQGLDIARGADMLPEVIQIVTVGGLAYAHYHMENDLALIRRHRYALMALPTEIPVFLNDPAKPKSQQMAFRVSETALRAVYESANVDDDPPPAPVPCVKLAGTYDPTGSDTGGPMFTIDTVMLVPYADPPPIP